MGELEQRINSLAPEQRRLLEARLKRQRAQTPSPPRPVSDDEPRVAPDDNDAAELKFSLFFFASSASGGLAAETYDFLIRASRWADEHGFHAVWTPERHFDPFGGEFSSPAVLAAAVATATERIGVRAGSVVLPLNDVIRVAEDWSVVDNLSRGRVGLSLASGWHPQDFVLGDVAYDHRKKVLEEQYVQLKRLLRGEAVSRTADGSSFSVRTYPRPYRDPMRMWLTSASSVETWRLAGRLGLNVLTALLEQQVDDVATNAAAYREALVEHGHDPSATEITVMAHTLVGDDVQSVRRLVRRPLSAYLRSHMGLYEKLARNRDIGIDVDAVSEADKEALVAFAFERYFSRNGLFGAPEDCMPIVSALRFAGATEIACLIDFGVDHDAVLSHLDALNRLRKLANEPSLALTHGGTR